MPDSIRDNASSWHAVRAERMRILGTVRRLAARPPSPWSVLSVYVNTRPVGAQMTTYRPFLKRRTAEELKALKTHSPEHESLSVDFARAQHYLDYDLREETKAVAIFASYAGEDLFDAVQLPVEFPEQQVVVGAMPVLFPLLRVADRYRRVAIAVVDGPASRLFILALGAIEIRREVRLASQGGPSLMARTAKALEELAQEAGASWIVIGGEASARAELRRELSAEALELLIDAGDWDPRLPESDIAADVTPRIDEREREARIERARILVASAMGPSAVLGVDATLEALRRDPVRELLVSETFPPLVPAWTCRACRAFGGGSPPVSCPACSRETVDYVPLREELGIQAQARGAAVLFVPAGSVPGFDDAGGVGAFLG
jgi:release factor family 2